MAICQFCGKSFERRLIAGPKRKFCSVRCRYDAHNEARRIPIERHKKPTMPKRYMRRCPFCGKAIGLITETTKRYCSTRCEFLSRHGVHGRGETDISAAEIERRFELAKARIRHERVQQAVT